MKRILLAATAALALVHDASAQMVCGSHAELLKQLAEKHQEVPIGIGLSANGAVVELLISADGTWTLLVTQPRGPTCLMGTGQDWQSISPPTDDPLKKDSAWTP